MKAFQWAVALGPRSYCGLLSRSMGTKAGPAFDRIDHLAIYADDKKPLWDFFKNTLGLDTMVPHTTYAFGEEDTEFDLQMLHLGNGVGVELYTDPSLKAWRKKLGKPNCTIANVGLTPAYNDMDRATSLMLRRGARFDGSPVVYHFTNEQLRNDPDLPRWLFKKFPIRIGDASFIHDDGAKWASRLQDIPQLTYFYLCMWHKDFGYRPSVWRANSLVSKMGPYGITGCNRIFWSVPDDEEEMSKLAMQFHRMNMVVNQLSAKELTVMFPEGPQLHIVAESASQRQDMMGRISGIEFAVSDWEDTRQSLQEREGLKVKTLGATEGFAEEATELSVSRKKAPKQVVPYNVSPKWEHIPGKDTGALPLQGSRFIIDTDQLGCPGIELHFVPANKLQLRLARASEIQQHILSDETESKYIPESGKKSIYQLTEQKNARDGQLSLIQSKDVSPMLDQGNRNSLPAAITLSARTASHSTEFTSAGGRLKRYNDRRPADVAQKSLDEQEEERPSKPMSWIRELFVFNRL